MTEPKPIHVKPSFYAYNYYPLKEIALRYGYNLVMHGSLNRDMDLIAIPWAKELIGTVQEMVKEMADYIGGYILLEDEAGHLRFRKTYHGRDNYIINVNRSEHGVADSVCYDGNGGHYQDAQYYLDISVTPKI